MHDQEHLAWLERGINPDAIPRFGILIPAGFPISTPPAGEAGPGADLITTTPTETTPAGGTPGAVPFVAAAWRFSPPPARYLVQKGDTLSGIAITYLGSVGPGFKNVGAIAKLQPPNVHGPGPFLADRIFAGQPLVMPPEAAATAQALDQGALPPPVPGAQEAATAAPRKTSRGVIALLTALGTGIAGAAAAAVSSPRG